ncbi:MAG TPA: alpha/beta hydrolase [Steroidobacteraceae bacterium]|nr:alpha/beta hydrolase [Steroidobacteraceae bacterium]
MTPFFFGDPKRPLYARYHAPRVAAAPGPAVLLCPSIAHEHAGSSAALSVLARRLAANGRHVLCFDFSATGESAGDIGRGQFLRWLRDVDLALEELAGLAGTGGIAVAGVRVGALLAATALATVHRAVHRLVLWDPVERGAEFMAALEAQHRRQLGRRRPAPAGHEDLLGYRFPADLRRNLAFTDLREVLASAAGPAAVIARSLDAAAAALEAP